eukprot:m.61717 g.61717  ORF g.61717 m.61717 type:complete len:453 (-) comp8002_c0_seq1:81-1439(-)
MVYMRQNLGVLLSTLVAFAVTAVLIASTASSLPSPPPSASPHSCIRTYPVIDADTCFSQPISTTATANGYICSCSNYPNGTTVPFVQFNNTVKVATSDVGEPSLAFVDISSENASCNFTFTVTNATNSSSSSSYSVPTQRAFSWDQAPSSISLSGTPVDYDTKQSTTGMTVEFGFSRCVTNIIEVILSYTNEENNTIAALIHMDPPSKSFIQNTALNYMATTASLWAETTSSASSVISRSVFPSNYLTSAVIFEGACTSGYLELLTNLTIPNSGGESASCSEGTKSISYFLALPPSAPSNLDVNVTTNNTIEVTWELPLRNGGCALNTYNFTLMEGSDSSAAILSRVFQASPTSKHISIPTESDFFKHDTTYYVRLSACTQAGCSSSAIVSFHTKEETSSKKLTIIIVSVCLTTVAVMILLIFILLVAHKKRTAVQYSPIVDKKHQDYNTLK